MQVDQKQHQYQGPPFFSPMQIKSRQQCSQKKRHVIYKHDLPVNLEKAAGTQKQHASEKAEGKLQAAFFQQMIKQQNGEKISANGIDG